MVGSGFKLTYMTVIETHVLTFHQKSEMTSVEEVVAEKFKGSDGPIFCSLEGALKKWKGRPTTEALLWVTTCTS